MTWDMVQDPIQNASVLVVLFTLYLMYRWAKHDLTRLLWAIPGMLWFLHGLVFYGVVQATDILHPMPIGTFTAWSASLRVHGYLTVCYIMITLVKLNGRVDHHHGQN